MKLGWCGVSVAVSLVLSGVCAVDAAPVSTQETAATASHVKKVNKVKEVAKPVALPPVPNIIFEEAQRSQNPMTNDQLISHIRSLISNNQIITSNALPPLKVVNRSISASFNDGAANSAITVGDGYVTSIAFEGENGTPWPVVAATVGNKDLFPVTGPDGAKGAKANGAPTNVVIVSATTFGGNTTMSVLLKGAPSPITLQLRSSKSLSDGTLIVRMNRPSPNSPPPIMEPSVRMPVTNVMFRFLQGLPPKGAIAMSSSLLGVHAWRIGRSLYVRSRYPLVSPAWISSSKDPDGERVYEVPDVSVLLMSVDGTIHYVNLHRSLTIPGVSLP